MFDKVYLGDTLIDKIFLGDVAIKYNLAPPVSNNTKVFALASSGYMYELDYSDFSIIKKSGSNSLLGYSRYIVATQNELWWAYEGSGGKTNYMGTYSQDNFSKISEQVVSQRPYRTYASSVIGGGQVSDSDFYIFNSVDAKIDTTMHRYSRIDDPYPWTMGGANMTMPSKLGDRISYQRDMNLDNEETLWVGSSYCKLQSGVKLKEDLEVYYNFSEKDGDRYFVWEMNGTTIKKYNADKTVLLETKTLPQTFDCITFLET